MNSANINLHCYYSNNTYLHNFCLFDMGSFWTKIYKNLVHLSIIHHLM